MGNGGNEENEGVNWTMVGDMSMNNSPWMSSTDNWRGSRPLPPTLTLSRSVLGTGASEIHNAYIGEDLAAMLAAYIVGIKDVFIYTLAGSALAVLLALAIPFKKLPNHDSKMTEENVVIT